MLKFKSKVNPLVAVARESLSQLEKEMHEAWREWQHARDLWQSAKSIVEAEAKRASGKHMTLADLQKEVEPVQQKLTLRNRVPKGLIYKHVEEVLKDGESYTHTDLRAEMNKRFGIDHSHTSIYRALGKGKAEKRYKLEGNQWSKA